MSNLELPSSGNNPISAASGPLTVEIVPSVVRMHYLAESVLDQIAALGSSIHLTFFGLCGGAAIAFGIVLTTTTITDPRIYGGYVGVFVASAIGAIYFGIRGGRDNYIARKTLKEIKSKGILR